MAVKCPSVGDRMMVEAQENSGTWVFAQIVDERGVRALRVYSCTRNSGCIASMFDSISLLASSASVQMGAGREVLVRQVPKSGRVEGRHEQWLPCSSHRFRCSCDQGHLLMMAREGKAACCLGDYGRTRCPLFSERGSLPASDSRVWCPICPGGDSQANVRCLACANACVGTKQAAPVDSMVRGTQAEGRQCSSMLDSLPEPADTAAAAATAAAAIAEAATEPQLQPAISEQQRLGLSRLRRLPVEDAGHVRISAKLCESLGDAHDIDIYAIHHPPAQERFELSLRLEPALETNVQELWHST